ncbi:unnamed protein product [Chrysoparadoxa australica]
MTRLCGQGQALKYLLTGDRFDAEEAARIGMVEYLTEPGEELTKAREIAGQITGYAPHATQAVKAAVRGAMDLSLEQGLRNENELMSLCFAKAEQAKLRATQSGEEP